MCGDFLTGRLIPSPRFDRSQHSREVNRFGFFGQFIDNKGIDVVLEALVILARENRVPSCGVEFQVNGGNRHYASASYLEKVGGLMTEIQRLAVGPIRIYERGSYGRDQLEERMAAVDWVIVPSTWWEIFGLVVSEAWMFGRPVIASAIGGLAERIENGVNGFTFRARDARALANVIATCAGNEEKWSVAQTGIAQPMTDLEMFEAHLALWEGRRDGVQSPKPVVTRDETPILEALAEREPVSANLFM